MSSGIKPGIRKSDVAQLKMPLPPLEVQQDLVNRLNALSNVIISLENQVKCAEDDARTVLKSYLGSNV